MNPQNSETERLLALGLLYQPMLTGATGTGIQYGDIILFDFLLLLFVAFITLDKIFKALDLSLNPTIRICFSHKENTICFLATGI